MMINSGRLRLSAGASGENGSSVMATRCRFATAKTTIKTPSGNPINAVANLPSMSVLPSITREAFSESEAIGTPR